MGGSRKPGRRRAASGSLGYSARPPRRTTAPSGRRRDIALGSGCAAAVALAIVVPVAGSTLGGTELWRWARDSFPGGGYGFAVAVGALVPAVLTAGAASVGRLKRAAGRIRSVAWATAAVACCALLMGLGTACVGMVGPSRRSRDRTGEWAYEHYEWIWAVALLSALITGALIATLLTLRARGRARRGAESHGSPEGAPAGNGPEGIG
ncbi:hypothetical protein [Streptomyces sp. NPDC057496]|uniref:hypothetical protein n=1 Tax=Streptomyces sp. NPDC057496 TaxID=3346149 RepID=UPI0036C6FC7E